MNYRMMIRANNNLVTSIVIQTLRKVSLQNITVSKT